MTRTGKVAVFAVVLAAIVAAGAAAVSLNRPVNVSVNVPPFENLGASGQVQTAPSQFMDTTYIAAIGDLDGLPPNITSTTIPGGPASTTAGLLTAARICENSVINVQLPAWNANLTLPSSSAMFSRCLRQYGDVREFYIYSNQTSTNGTFTLVISDATSSLKSSFASSTNFTTSSLNFGDVGIVRAIRIVTSSPTAVGSSTPWLDWVFTAAK